MENGSKGTFKSEHVEEYYEIKWDTVRDLLLYLGKRRLCSQLMKLYGKGHSLSRYSVAKDCLLGYIGQLEAEVRRLKDTNKSYCRRIEELSQLDLFERDGR